MKYQIDYEKGIAHVGNLSRMKNLMERAGRGDEIHIGFIGGSITQGSLSSAPRLCYAYRVYEWWCRSFPKSKFSYINAGIGGTTSQFGVARVEEDLLEKKPDFVVIEFSVNDESTEHFMETYEGLVRRIYGAEGRPAVLLVHNVYYHNGANAQLMHGRIGRHYDLPAVSMQSSIYPEVVKGHIANRDITPDDLHPNDTGHELVASVITYFLEQVRCGGLSWEEGETAGCQAGSDRKEWRTAGDAITFSVDGTGIAVQYRKSVALPVPVAEVIVDGDPAHAVRLDANFDETWGDKLELDTILEHGEDRVHQVEIRLVETHEDDAVPFYLVSVIASR